MAYKGHPIAPTTWDDPVEHIRRTAEAANSALDGHINAREAITLTASQATTVVTDYRVHPDSVILFEPLTANAATELYGATMWVTSKGKQTFTIGHANNAEVDRDFLYVALG
tara:strand:+ start:541 stop:876 length:336 start_codon:yes stop_codon:yes gene_type:complete